MKRWFLVAMPFVVWFVVVEIAVRSGLIASFVLPTPTSVFESLFVDRVELLGGLGVTLISSVAGLMLSGLLGLTIAILMAVSSNLRQALEPYAVFFQTVPVIALAPVLVIWFGFGQPTVIASAFIVSVFPVIASATSGLCSTDAAWMDLFRIYRASPMTTLWKLRLPAALPQIFTGLRVSSGLAVIGAVVGEFIAGGGLGEAIDSARTQQRLDKVFAAVLLSSALGLILVWAIDFLSHWLLRSWHPSEKVDSARG